MDFDELLALERLTLSKGLKTALSQATAGRKVAALRPFQGLHQYSLKDHLQASDAEAEQLEEHSNGLDTIHLEESETAVDEHFDTGSQMWAAFVKQTNARGSFYLDVRKHITRAEDDLAEGRPIRSEDKNAILGWLG